MRAPEFWDAPPGVARRAAGAARRGLGLAPARLRRAVARPYRAPVPVICVGNLVAGGAGKTPVVLSLARLIAGSRRRGACRDAAAMAAASRGPVRVDPALHDAAAVGDEALAAGGAARRAGWRAIGPPDAAPRRRPAPRSILLDDGFQNPGLGKDISLSSSMPNIVSATAGSSRRDRCANRSRRGLPAPTPSS